LDASAPERAEETRSVLERALASPELAGAPLLLLANKRDLAGPAGCTAALAALGPAGAEGAGERASRAFHACAHSGEGLREGLAWVVEAARAGRRARLLAERAAAQSERGP